MKRPLALILCAALALSLCACVTAAARETFTEAPAEPVMAVDAAATEMETALPPQEGEFFALFKFIFLPMAKGEISSTFDDFTAAVKVYPYAWREKNGIYYAQDLQNPGDYMALICAGEKISQMVYRSILDGTERMVRVSFAEENPRYFIKATAFHDGVEVLSPKELQKYITNRDLFSEETPEGISNRKMIDILSDDGVFYSLDLYSEKTGIAATTSEYCAMLSAEIGVPSAITKVAVVDLDGDGIREVLFWLTVNDSTDYGTLILHDYGKNVVGHLFTYRQLYNLKEDGSFWRSGSDYEGPSRLAFIPGGWSYAEADADEYSAHEILRWSAYPMEDYSELFE